MQTANSKQQTANSKQQTANSKNKYLGSKFLISLSCCLASYHVTAGTLGQLEIKQRVVLPRATMLQLAVGY